jgi:hypothetical protein
MHCNGHIFVLVGYQWEVLLIKIWRSMWWCNRSSVCVGVFFSWWWCVKKKLLFNQKVIALIFHSCIVLFCRCDSGRDWYVIYNNYSVQSKSFFLRIFKRLDIYIFFSIREDDKILRTVPYSVCCLWQRKNLLTKLTNFIIIIFVVVGWIDVHVHCHFIKHW